MPAAAVNQVTVAVGDEELLVERAVASVIARARAADADTDVRDLLASALEPGQLAELTSPSLFGERRVLVLRDVEQLAKEMVDEVSAALRLADGELGIVLTHKGGARGKQLVDAALAEGAIRVDCAKITRPGERIDFVRAEFRGASRSISESGARALIDTVGTELRELAAACAQLCTDTDGQVDSEDVARYYRGRAEANGFAVSDRALEGRLGDALEQLRWALAVGTAPVLITSALAQGIRALAKVASAPRGLRGADLARDVEMPPWKVERVQRQLPGWTPVGVAAAVTAIARADEQVKGGGTDAGYALEQAVLAIVAARGSV